MDKSTPLIELAISEINVCWLQTKGFTPVEIEILKFISGGYPKDIKQTNEAIKRTEVAIEGLTTARDSINAIKHDTPGLALDACDMRKFLTINGFDNHLISYDKSILKAESLPNIDNEVQPMIDALELLILSLKAILSRKYEGIFKFQSVSICTQRLSGMPDIVYMLEAFWLKKGYEIIISETSDFCVFLAICLYDDQDKVSSSKRYYSGIKPPESKSQKAFLSEERDGVIQFKRNR